MKCEIQWVQTVSGMTRNFVAGFGRQIVSPVLFKVTLQAYQHFSGILSLFSVKEFRLLCYNDINNRVPGKER